MRDISDRPPVPAVPSSQRKRLGGYLIEAGLLTQAQIDVALNDQKLTGMRFGEILAARGWVKQQTIEYLMQKVVLPEQQAQQQKPIPAQKAAVKATADGLAPATNPATNTDHSQPATRRDIPIAKPLPSVGSSDGDVSWVG